MKKWVYLTKRNDQKRWINHKSDPMIAVSFHRKIQNPFNSFYSLPSHANLLDLWLITWCFLIFLWVFTYSGSVDCRHQTWKEYSYLTQKIMRSDEIDKCVMYACYQILNLSVRSKNCRDHSPNDCMLWEFLFEWILFLIFLFDFLALIWYLKHFRMIITKFDGISKHSSYKGTTNKQFVQIKRLINSREVIKGCNITPCYCAIKKLKCSFLHILIYKYVV